MEGGLLATFKGLTIRPGDTLRSYLAGARAPFMSPGRYLLVSILISFGVRQGLMWLGLLEGLQVSLSNTEEGDEIEAGRAFAEVIPQLMQSQWAAIATTLVGVGLLALIFRRLFREEMGEWAAALAASASFYGHVSILSSMVFIPHVSIVFLWTGQPAGRFVGSVFPALEMVTYVGGAAHRLVPSWKSAVKAGLSVL